MGFIKDLAIERLNGKGGDMPIQIGDKVEISVTGEVIKIERNNYGGIDYRINILDSEGRFQSGVSLTEDMFVRKDS